MVVTRADGDSGQPQRCSKRREHSTEVRCGVDRRRHIVRCVSGVITRSVEGSRDGTLQQDSERVEGQSDENRGENRYGAVRLRGNDQGDRGDEAGVQRDNNGDEQAVEECA